MDRAALGHEKILDRVEQGGPARLVDARGVRFGARPPFHLRRIVGATPLVGPLARRVRRAVRGPELAFSRLDAADELGRLGNILNYAKTSDTAYSALPYPAGYHTVRLADGSEIVGQRDPARRIELLSVEMSGKTILDLGCNQGGMLFALRDRIDRGIGVDYDHRMINAANRLRANLRAANLDFYVFDLEREPLELIRDLVPDGRVDVVFLLAVCMWLGNWRRVIDFAHSISTEMIFESNGTQKQQTEQETYLRARYKAVTLLAGQSEDDPVQKQRKLFHAQTQS